MTADPLSHYTIRVTARQPDTETSFVGAIYLAGDGGDLQLLDERTPFEVSGSANLVSGMIQACDPTEQVHVEVLCAEGGEDPKRVTMARGRTILLGERLVRGTSRFIRTAR